MGFEERLAGEVTEAAAEAKLPGTLKETLEMLATVQLSQPKDKFESRVRAIKLEKLQMHLHAQSQVPAAPRIDHKKFWTREVPAAALAFIEAQYPKTKTRKA